MNGYSGTIVLLAFLLATLGTASGCITATDTAGTGLALLDDPHPGPAQGSGVASLTGVTDYSEVSENESVTADEVQQENSSFTDALTNYAPNESLTLPADETGDANLSGYLANDSLNESLTYPDDGSLNSTLTGDQETPLHLDAIHFLPSTPPISSRFLFPLNGTLSAVVLGQSSRQVEYAWDIDGDDHPEYTTEHPDHSYGAPGEYEVTLTVIDTASGRNATRTDLLWVPEYLVPLHPGWNFVSVPRELAPYAILRKIMDLNLTGDHPVLGYQPLTGWEPLDGGTRVSPLDGIWIYSTEESELSLIFSTDPAHLPPVKDLSAGWNAIGFTDIAPVPANETLSSLGDLWTSCTGYNASSQSYDPSILRDSKGASNDSGLLRPGRGYWLYVSGNGTLAAIGA